jgi:biotin carboxylase
MGDKVEARKAMIAAGLPVTPGSPRATSPVSSRREQSPRRSATR